MRTEIHWISSAMILVAAVMGAALAVAAAEAREPRIAWDHPAGRIVMSNGQLELTVDTASGLNPKLLRDPKSGRVYADRDYCWPGGEFPKMQGDPVIEEDKDGRRTRCWLYESAEGGELRREGSLYAMR